MVPAASQNTLSVSRIGPSNDNRPRLIKVVFNNVLLPKMILRNKLLLRSSAYSHVVVQDDKPPEEIQLLKTLRETLRARRAAGEHSLTIKYLRGTPSIVDSGPKN